MLNTLREPARSSRAIQKVVQLNEAQEYSFSRNEFIDILDKAMGATASTR